MLGLYAGDFVLHMLQRVAGHKDPAVAAGYLSPLVPLLSRRAAQGRRARAARRAVAPRSGALIFSIVQFGNGWPTASTRSAAGPGRTGQDVVCIEGMPVSHCSGTIDFTLRGKSVRPPTAHR